MLNLDFSTFPNNKYSKWYIALVATRNTQLNQSYKTEAHHVYPVSLYGSNKNVVHLTYREHYIAHLLLWKMFNGTNHGLKMAKALYCMQTVTNKCNKRQLYKIKNSKLFEVVRKEAHLHLSKKRKEHFKNPDNYERMVATNRRITSTDSWRKQRSEKQKEFSSNKEYREKRTDAMMTPEAREKSATNSLKAIRAMSDAERKVKFTRHRTPEQIAAHGNKIRGRKKVINLETKQVKVVHPEELHLYFNTG